MNTAAMMERLRAHPVSRELGVEMCLGFPFYEIRANALHARFWAHRERVSEGGASFFRPAYRLDFAFPFRHLCHFENLVLEGVPDAGMPAHRTEDGSFLKRYAEVSSELAGLSDRILREAQENGIPSEARILDYDRALRRGIAILGLEDVYSAEVK